MAYENASHYAISNKISTIQSIHWRDSEDGAKYAREMVMCTLCTFKWEFYLDKLLVILNIAEECHIFSFCLKCIS